MKALLLKDLYAINSYLRAFLILEAVLILAACFSAGNNFLLFYPCILSGMISMTLISYEEKEKWNTYAATLPFSKAQLVSSKYILSLLMSLLAVAIICLLQLTGENGLAAAGSMLLILLPLSLLPAAILLPFVYKLGAEKGRICYYVVLGFTCSIIAMLSANGVIDDAADSAASLSQSFIGVAVIVLSCLIYSLSWCLSIRFYQKREL